jgi:arylsulfatase A-like enzyme
MPFVLPLLGSHRYLRPGFRLRERSRQFLLGRYHDAITLTDQKLAWFWEELRARGLLDDLLLIITSDDGEAFGEHGLYLHDASVFQTHLHVPLFVHHPARHATPIADPVSTRDLFGLLRAVGQGDTAAGTLLDPEYRAAHHVIRAEHFHYTGAPWIDARYRHDLRAVIAGTRKFVRRGTQVRAYDLTTDAGEEAPRSVPAEDTFTEGALTEPQAAWLLAPTNGHSVPSV